MQELSENNYDMEADMRVRLMTDAVSCSIPLHLWCYDRKGCLIYTTAEGEDVQYLRYIFEGPRKRRHPLEEVLTHVRDGQLPMLLGAEIGLIWGAVCVPTEDAPVYVIGPVLQQASSFGTFEAQISGYLRDYQTEGVVSLNEKYRYIHALQNLSAISVYYFQDIVLMLHYAAVGEKLTRSALYLSKADAAQDQTEAESGLRTWKLEQLFTDLVRNGDLSYTDYLPQLGLYVRGMNIRGKDSARGLKLQCQMLSALYAHAAIEGGLSPDAAYRLSDSYLQQAENGITVTELMQLNQEMLGDFVHSVHEASRQNGYSLPVQHCIDYMEMYAERGMDIDMLAEELHYTRAYLTRRFKAETGMRMSEYLNRIRIRRAKHLLNTTDAAIEEIAASVGFCSGSYFAKIFRRVEGMTPAQYRGR